MLFEEIIIACQFWKVLRKYSKEVAKEEENKKEIENEIEENGSTSDNNDFHIIGSFLYTTSTLESKKEYTKIALIREETSIVHT